MRFPNHSLLDSLFYVDQGKKKAFEEAYLLN